MRGLATKELITKFISNYENTEVEVIKYSLSMNEIIIEYNYDYSDKPYFKTFDLLDYLTFLFNFDHIFSK